MKQNIDRSDLFFDEGGVAFTRTHLTLPGRRLNWGELSIVRFEQRESLLDKIPSSTFHLVLSTKKDPTPVSVFETRDSELVGRISAALARVAAAVGGKREV